MGRKRWPQVGSSAHPFPDKFFAAAAEVWQRLLERISMQNCRVSVPTSILALFVFASLINGQSAGKEIGKFRERPCPFPLPEGLVLGENFRFGYVTVPEIHGLPNDRTL